MKAQLLRIAAVMCAVILIITGTACAESASNWEIELRDYTIADELHTGAGVPQYDGSTLDVDYDDVPSDGNVFLILTMTITKVAAGGGAFKWADLSVVDANGNAYSRMENDAFIANHTFNRMSGTSLQIGENKGSICVEIPADAANGSLTLVYNGGAVSIPIK